MIEAKNLDNKLNFEVSVEKINKRFIAIAESEELEEKLLLDFFREKYTHFMLYSELIKNNLYVQWEKKTKLKFRVMGNIDRSGNHDLVVVDKNNNALAGFEIYLGYDVGQKSFTASQFEKHLLIDYNKLMNSNMSEVYIINYFYKGCSKRSTPNRTEKKEEVYRQHFSSCVSICKNLAMKHQKSEISIRFGLWIVEARDDGFTGNGVIRFI
jgi:hypothetical protein